MDINMDFFERYMLVCNGLGSEAAKVFMFIACSNIKNRYIIESKIEEGEEDLDISYIDELLYSGLVEENGDRLYIPF